MATAAWHLLNGLWAALRKHALALVPPSGTSCCLPLRGDAPAKAQLSLAALLRQVPRFHNGFLEGYPISISYAIWQSLHIQSNFAPGNDRQAGGRVWYYKRDTLRTSALG